MNLLAPPAVNTDALSPMLVKELRQGMKSKAFGFSFLLMQLLMVFCMLLAVTTQSARGADEFHNGLFWFCIGATLVFITPLRAMSSLQQEIKGNTLELIFLTRLGAWRIVTGKWAALYSQALLLTAAALPYLLMRYFMGGVDIAADLLLLLQLLAGSSVLTAIGVCISTTRAQWVRGLVIAVSVISPYLIALFASLRAMSHRMGGSAPAAVVTPHPVLVELINLVGAAALTALFLSWAAGRIAPDAENHARWKRVLALALVALLPALVQASGDTAWMLSGLFVALPVCADALCERPRPIPSLYAPFARRGTPGLLAGLFLLPGWPSGLLFTLLVGGLYGGLTILTMTPSTTELDLLASAPGAILVPAALVLTFKPKAQKPGTAFFVLTLLFFVIAMIALALDASFPDLSLLALSLLPPVAFMLHLCGNGGELLLPLTAMVTGAALVPLLVRLRRALLDQRPYLRAAQASPPPP